MDDDQLRFPSGRTLRNCRMDAKRLAKVAGIPLFEAQDRVALSNGGQATWARSLQSLRLLATPTPALSGVVQMTADDIRAVIAAEAVTRSGYGPNPHRIKDLGSYAAALKEGQDELLAGLDECNRAARFLHFVDKRKTDNWKVGSSYGLKHQAERYLRKLKAAPDNAYISNGAFICAALHMGFEMKVELDSPNVTFNMSSRSPIFEWARLSGRNPGQLPPQAFVRLEELERLLEVVPTARPWLHRQREMRA